MPPTDTYLEEISSQLPALQLLINLGWQYLTPGEALALRDGKLKNVVLNGVLESWLIDGDRKSFDLYYPHKLSSTASPTGSATTTCSAKCAADWTISSMRSKSRPAR